MTVKPNLEVVASHLHPDGRGCAATGGDGLERLELRIVDLLPGEAATVTIEHRSAHHPHAWGRIESRTGPLSPERAPPACPAYGDCGGCAWQHLAVAGQRREKHQRVISALRAAGVEAAVAAPVAAPATLGYRNKGKYVVGVGEPDLVLGAYRPGTGEVVSTLGCRVVEPVIDDAARALARHLRVEAGLRYVVIRSGSDGRAVVGLIGRAPAPDDAALALCAAIADDVAGVVWFQNDRDDGALLDGAGVCLAGRETVIEELAIPGGGALRFDIPLTGFWQVNRAQAARIYARIAELASEVDGPVLDAYAGVAAIGLILAANGREVTAVERDGTAVRAARAAATRAGLALDIHQLDATGVLGRTSATTVIVNPPRKGLAPAGLEALGAGSCQHLLYLSCGPESLARDLSALVRHGYSIASVEPYDLMPGTAQIETLVSLRR